MIPPLFAHCFHMAGPNGAAAYVCQVVAEPRRRHVVCYVIIDANAKVVVKHGQHLCTDLERARIHATDIPKDEH